MLEQPAGLKSQHYIKDKILLWNIKRKRWQDNLNQFRQQIKLTIKQNKNNAQDNRRRELTTLMIYFFTLMLSVELKIYLSIIINSIIITYFVPKSITFDMGCVSQKKSTHPQDMVMFPKGVLQVEVQNAVLLRDTSIMLKMDPYLILKIGDQVLRSLIHKNQGTYPVFNQKFIFYINSDKIPFGRSIQISVWDHNVGIDREIGFGIIDIDTILLNRINNFPIKCHINHLMKSAGWVKATLKYRQQYKGKLLIKPKQSILKRKIGMGNMNCAVKVTVGEDVSVSKISPDLKDDPPKWNQTLYLNLLDSLSKGRLQIVNISSYSEEQICYADLDLDKLSTKEETEHDIDLIFNQARAGSIKISSMFMNPEEFSRRTFETVEQKKQLLENKSLHQSDFQLPPLRQSALMKSNFSRQ